MSWPRAEGKAVSELIPDDDLYARLDVASDATPGEIELAWRLLIRLHHPDVAGDDRPHLDLAKRTNVAHDWLADPARRARYDESRGGRPAKRARAAEPPPRPSHRPSPPTNLGPRSAEVQATLDRLLSLTPNEIDRLRALGSAVDGHFRFRKFVSEGRRSAYDWVHDEGQVALDRILSNRDWRMEDKIRLGFGVYNYLAWLVAGDLFIEQIEDSQAAQQLREMFIGPFVEAMASPLRYGPNSEEVASFIGRLPTLTKKEARRLASKTVDLWTAPDRSPRHGDPTGTSCAGCRASIALAEIDARAALPSLGLGYTRARKLDWMVGVTAAYLVVRLDLPSGGDDRLYRRWAEIAYPDRFPTLGTQLRRSARRWLGR